MALSISARDFRTLIEGLLAFSRVQTRAKELQPTDCQVVLHRALANLKIALQETNAQVSFDPLPTVLADALQMEQLFQNLIGNSVKFRSQEPVCVHVSARPSGNEWIFSVRDNGIGFDPIHNDRIFGLFQRLHPRDKYPGTGIGLSICKKVVERHGGKIWVEAAEGQGATFYFTVPSMLPVEAVLDRDGNGGSMNDAAIFVEEPQPR